MTESRVSTVVRISFALMVALTSGCEVPDALDCNDPSLPTNCAGKCVNVNTDAINCGSCGRVCPTGLVCVNGNCANNCPDSQKICQNRCIDKNGCCVDTDCKPDESCIKDVCGPKADMNPNQNPDLSGMDSSVNPPPDMTDVTPKPDMTDTRDMAIPPMGDGGPNNPCPPGSMLCGNICTNTNNDPNNCGACGMHCKVNEACLNGGCVPLVVPMCGFPTQQCGNQCVNTQIDPVNCGGCSRVCSANHIFNNDPTCTGGVCKGACKFGWDDCNSDKMLDGCEFPVHSDVNNCGACNYHCGPVLNGMPMCLNASCITSCTMGFGDCDGVYNNGCERNLMNDINNCGSCGTVCRGGAVCASGSCVCPQGETACNLNCVNLAADPNNCGACGVACGQGFLCSTGKCVPNCSQGFNPCGNACFNFLNDPSNCGGCGIICPPVANGFGVCGNGKCQVANCQPGFADCNNNPNDGCEKNTLNDPLNCGACNKACPNGQSCSNGACVVQCNNPFTACNNSCVDLRSDTNNCGACGIACGAGKACFNSGCISICQPGEVQCNAICRDLANDANNCGACNKVCPVVQNGLSACVQGICTGACNNGFGDCNMNLNDGCEKNLLNDAANCGKCGTVCPNGQSCVNGVCGGQMVVDAGASDLASVDMQGQPPPPARIHNFAIDALYAGTLNPKTPSQGDFVGGALAPVSVTIEGKAAAVPVYQKDTGYVFAAPVVAMNQVTFRVIWCYTLGKVNPDPGTEAVSWWPSSIGGWNRRYGNAGVTANGQICFTEDLPVSE